MGMKSGVAAATALGDAAGVARRVKKINAYEAELREREARGYCPGTEIQGNPRLEEKSAGMSAGTAGTSACATGEAMVALYEALANLMTACRACGHGEEMAENLAQAQRAIKLADAAKVARG
jgi:hypothetical protein